MMAFCRSAFSFLICLAIGKTLSVASVDSPVQKVLQLLSDLEQKVSTEGVAAKTTYEEFKQWCTDRSKNLEYEIKVGASEVEDLKANIEQASASVESYKAEIEGTASRVSTNEADLKAAKQIRETEVAEFSAEEKELVEIVSMLERATNILQRELRKGRANFAQFHQVGNVTDALRVLVDAFMMQSEDAAKLQSFLQRSTLGQDDAEDDELNVVALGAPDPVAYKSHSATIVETLQGILGKARDQLAEVRTREANAQHNFLLLEQSMSDEIRFANQGMEEARKDLASAQEAAATSQGGLANAQKSSSENQNAIATIKTDCMTKSQDYEAASKSRADELEALRSAKAVLQAKTSGGASLTHSSFLQMSSIQIKAVVLRTSADLANFEVVRFVRRLAQTQHSQALTQLSRRLAAAMSAGESSGQDPFAKVRGLIADMIERLESDANSEASHKAYCDKASSETLAEKANKEAVVDKLSSRIDSMSSMQARLKSEVVLLQQSIAEMAKSYSEMLQLRQDEASQYAHNTPEMEAGLDGVKTAIRILREYYAKDDTEHEVAKGSAQGIIDLLEVIESDISKRLAEMSATEATAKAEFESYAKENEISRITKEKDITYKSRETTRLESLLGDATSDRAGTQSELDALVEYNSHLVAMCLAKPDTYQERSARRQAELVGLREALNILEGNEALLQRRSASKRMKMGFLYPIS